MNKLKSEILKKRWQNPEFRKMMIGVCKRKGWKHHTEESKKKISDAHMGLKYPNRKSPPPFTEEHLRKMSKSMKKVWRTSEYRKKRVFSEETLRKMSEWHKKNPSRYWLGKKHTEKAKKKMSEALKGKFKGENNPFYGKHHTEKTKEKISKWNLKNSVKYWLGKKRPEISGKNHPNWIKDRNLLEYPDEFSEKLKAQIKKRDNHTCRICGKTDGRLSVHHIDYDKKNNNPDNLITLCESCHMKTNFNRNYWIRYFRKINERRRRDMRCKNCKARMGDNGRNDKGEYCDECMSLIEARRFWIKQIKVSPDNPYFKQMLANVELLLKVRKEGGETG